MRETTREDRDPILSLPLVHRVLQVGTIHVVDRWEHLSMEAGGKCPARQRDAGASRAHLPFSNSA